MQITESTNNLTLSEDSNKGIGLHLALTAGTAAEFIHVDTTCVATIANIIQSKLWAMIKSSTDTAICPPWLKCWLKMYKYSWL